MNVHIATLFLVAKRWKRPRCPLIRDQSVNKYIYLKYFVGVYVYIYVCVYIMQLVGVTDISTGQALPAWTPRIPFPRSTKPTLSICETTQ